MKNTGITRKVDELGRIVIPMEMRRSMNLPEGTALEIYVHGGDIILHRPLDTCSCCGLVADDLVKIKGVSLCKGCLAAVVGYAAGEEAGTDA